MSDRSPQFVSSTEFQESIARVRLLYYQARMEELRRKEQEDWNEYQQKQMMLQSGKGDEKDSEEEKMKINFICRCFLYLVSL